MHGIIINFKVMEILKEAIGIENERNVFYFWTYEKIVYR